MKSRTPLEIVPLTYLDNKATTVRGCSVTDRAAIERFLVYLRSRNYAEKTIREYGIRLDLAARELQFKTATSRQLEAHIFAAGSQSLKRQRYKALNRFYQWARRVRYVTRDPMGNVESPKKPRPHFRAPASKEAICAVLRSAPEQTRIAVAVASLAGLRCQEICNLEWAHVDFDAKVIYVWRGKGDKDRVVPMSDRLAHALTVYGRRKSGYVIPAMDLGPRESRSLSTSVARDFHLAGYPYTLHQCRHYFATEAYRACKDVAVVAALLGHKSWDTTMIYVHMSGEDGRAAVDDVGSNLAA